MTADKEISEIIQNCWWRIKDIDVCRGMCLPCIKVIESGQCETLQEYFSNQHVGRKDGE